MDIELRYFTGCPSWQIAAERLAAVVAERPDTTVTHRLVETVEEAERLRFHGSPSIVVDGVDVFADAETPVGLSCRIYQTPDGPAGSPTIEQIRAVISRR